VATILCSLDKRILLRNNQENTSSKEAKMLIGLFGPRRSGKGTICKALKEALPDVVECQFSWPVKELVCQVLEVGTFQPERDEALKQDSRLCTLINPEPINVFLKRHGLPQLTREEIELLKELTLSRAMGEAYRALLQHVATDIVRKRDESCWVRAAFQALPEEKVVVFSDGRFWNEFTGVKARGGVTVGVWREGLPQYEHVAEYAGHFVAWHCDLRGFVPSLKALQQFIETVVLPGVKQILGRG